MDETRIEAEKRAEERGDTYGVKRLLASLAITSIPRLRATAITVFKFPKSIPTTLIEWKSVEKDGKFLVESLNQTVKMQMFFFKFG